MTDTDARLIERLREHLTVGYHDDGFCKVAGDGSVTSRPSTPMTRPANRDGTTAAARIESLTAELEHFIDIVDGTETTGFDPHVEQMLMDAAESARAALGDSK